MMATDSAGTPRSATTAWRQAAQLATVGIDEPVEEPAQLPVPGPHPEVEIDTEACDARNPHSFATGTPK